MRCKQQEMKGAIVHENTETGIKHLHGTKRVKDFWELHLLWKLQHHHPLRVIVKFCYFSFLEQLLTSFDVCHVTILFYIPFLVSYFDFCFLDTYCTCALHCETKLSNLEKKFPFLSIHSFFQLCEWKICMHCTLSEQPLNKIHQVAPLCKTCKYSIQLACPYPKKMKGQIKGKILSWNLLSKQSKLCHEEEFSESSLSNRDAAMRQGCKPPSSIASNSLCKPETN